MKIKIAVVCVSDRSSRGEREDVSGKVISEVLSGIAETTNYVIVPDEKEDIKNTLISLCEQQEVEMVFTTGGTGFAPRDVTPEATLEIAQKNAPGISEAIRQNSLSYTKNAMLSRAVSVIRNNKLIINLPGSPKAVKECLEFIKPVLPHANELLKGTVDSCARQ